MAGKITDNIAVNGNAGAFTSLTSSIVSRQVLIMEDPVNAPGGVLQGLQYQLGSENFSITHTLAAGETLNIENTVSAGAGISPIAGMPQQGSTGDQGFQAATVYAKVRSLTATATAVRLQEMP